jgi:hypothetical protein
MASQFTARPNDTFAQKLANLALSGVQVISIQTIVEPRALSSVDADRVLERAKSAVSDGDLSVTEDLDPNFSDRRVRRGTRRVPA